MNTKSVLLRKTVLSVLIPLLSGFSAYAEQPGPMLVPDYNRDGRISPTDRERALSGEAFTIWLNDDDDAEGTDGGSEAGDTNTDLHDVPGGNDDKDCDDDTVNGRCDLLDFFPVLVDVKFVDNWGYMTWKLCSDSVNVVFTQLKADNAGSFHTTEVKALDDDTPLYRATVVNLTADGVALPNGFLEERNGEGVFLVEGRAQGSRCLTLRGYAGEALAAEVTLNLSVVNVEDMYGWMNLRPKLKDGNSTVRLRLSTSTTPSTDSRHFVLVHGYNTNHEEARGNAAEFYKKLYQSGSDAMFTAVEWRGDQSQIKFDLLGVNFTPNYHVNVENAFAAARPFADACRKLPGEKILVAHSLGNVLVSSAIKDYGLDYTKYVMLNATVAREAFDASVTDTDMVDDDWLNLEDAPLLERASHWYENFADRKYDPYEYRRKLAWRGRFANLPRTVNYYSQSDNFLVNPAPNEPDPDKVFNPNDPEISRKVHALLEAKFVNGKSIGRGGAKKTGFGFWSFSEKMKGTWVIDAINDVLTNVLEVAQADAYKREGGWGENEDYDDNPERPFDPANTRFTPFLDERLKEPDMLDILPAETERARAQHLADAIPAESFAAGANPVAILENVDEESFIGENRDWPLFEGEEVHTNLWNHSAFREVAFYHTSKFYASLTAVGKPRVIIDTDLGSSMDDLWTIDFAARMHKAGKLDLMAVMMDRPDNSDEEERGEFLKFTDRYLASLGFANLPLGKSSNLAEDRLPQHVFNPYWTLIYSNDVSGASALMPTNRTDDQLAALTDAVSLYRRLLNNAPDRSVVICSIGFLNNLRALMESGMYYEGDDIAFTGQELIAAKVKELRIMGGCFDPATAPKETANGAEYNFAGDPVAAKKVVEEWPTPVVVSPWEVGLNLDYKADEVLADFPVGTPDPVLRAAYVYWPIPAGEGELNRPWDLATILPLTEGETLLPLSEQGGIAVDEHGVTTFTPNTSSNRCYQLASNMSTNDVLARFRAVFRTGNPSVTLLVSGKPEPGVDYNGSEIVFKFENLRLGSFAEEDLKFGFTIDGAEYAPESSEWDETLGVLSVRFTIPPDAVTAGNVYNGTLAVSLENETLGSVQLTSATRQLVQGSIDRGVPEAWFDEFNLEAPTNYVPETQMPEKTTAIVETTFLFENPSPNSDEPPPDGAQAAVRVIEDGEGGYKFQYYAFVGNEDGFYYRGWHDFNVGGEDVRELKPEVGQKYVVRMEGFYYEDARGEENTVVFSVAKEGSNEGFLKQFVGNLINEEGGLGGRTRLNSIELAGEGAVSSLAGEYCRNLVNANLARIDDVEYAMVADAVVAADGNPIRLLYAASWSPSMSDIGKSVRFLNKSLLHLDISGLPANARAVWTDVDGNNGTLTLELVYADTVVYGTIRTAEGTDYVEGAIAVADGKYVYVGDEAGVAAFIKDDLTKVVDHRGKGMVMPGCTDGHSHYINTIAMKNMKGGILFDIMDGKAAVLQKLSEATQKASDAGKTSLCGFGWNSQIILTNKLSLADLDEVTHGVSTVIFDSSGHHAFCNSECLKRCKILSEDGKTVRITEIDGGLLELKDGFPTGYVNERVTGYLTRMGGIDADELIDAEVAEDAILKSQELLLSTGYTAALDGWSNQMHPSKFYEVANRMDTDGELKFILPMTYEVEPWQTNMTEQIDYLALLRETYGTSHVLPEYLKVFMDGVVESRTGATIKPYKDGTYYKSFWSTNRLAEITRECNAKGLTVHTHTMGDAAIRETVDAYIYGGDGTHRNCLVHLRNVSTNDVNDFQRIADNNIACAAGLTWHATDTDFDNILKQFLCDEYVKHAYPMKSFLDAGVRASGHSDYPANIPSPQDPFGMMQVAVTGMVPDPGELDYPFDTNELITVEQAFQVMTLNGAWQLGLENERGSIKVGKWADFVLADQDVFECAVTNIAKTQVVSTWFEGEKVYEARTTVQVTPGVPVVFDTAEDATNGMEQAVITPSAEVAEMFGSDAEARSAYCAMFELIVGATTDGKWAVGAFLKPGPWTNVVESAQDATLQLPVQRIAEWQSGDDPIPVLLTNCVPGFYYSLFDGAAVTNVTPTMVGTNLNVLCGTDRKVTLPEVTKPIGGQNSGFFTIGVKETSDIEPGSEGKVPVPPVPHPGPYPFVH